MNNLARNEWPAELIVHHYSMIRCIPCWIASTVALSNQIAVGTLNKHAPKNIAVSICPRAALP